MEEQSTIWSTLFDEPGYISNRQRSANNRTLPERPAATYRQSGQFGCHFRWVRRFYFPASTEYCPFVSNQDKKWKRKN
ncbi:hypothetical protein [Mucilaginibacter sp. AK015]|uniref:hypothetical protein n=1 Tax=Mucilaginibacter sp. AK015 TaxID=2723072 RepID=UPI00160CF5B8|nr:hypothetical protein [Mucilaginibacter sp. AK015]MBB5395215.1 hypothetical protein [Mucilaginibacter sp. AK015]